MSVTKYLTENYRLSIMDDEIAIKILAHLYRNLPKSEDEIVEEFPNRNIKIKLAKLFKTSLIERDLNDLWRITFIGKLIMQKSDIASYIVDYQLQDLKLKKADYYFLLSCVKSQAYVDDNYYNSVSSYIKILTVLIKSEDLTISKQKDLLKESLYTYIVGLDENLNKVGVDSYPEFILSNIENYEYENVNPIRVIIKRNIDSLKTICFKSRDFIQESNKFILNFDCSHHSDYEWKNKSAKKSTFVRFINPIINKEMDNDLYTICKYNRNQIKFYENINSFSDELADITKIFRLNFKIGKSITEKIIEFYDVQNIDDKKNLVTNNLIQKTIDDLSTIVDSKDLEFFEDKALINIRNKVSEIVTKIDNNLLNVIRGNKHCEERAKFK